MMLLFFLAAVRLMDSICRLVVLDDRERFECILIPNIIRALHTVFKNFKSVWFFALLYVG